jgi:hypothetical protein
MPIDDDSILARRIRILEDERELRDLLARFAFNADLGRTKEYAELYTADAILDLRSMGLDRYEGQTSILEDFITGPASRRAGVAFHSVTPMVFYVDGDTAEGEGYSLMFVRNEDGSMAIVNAHYSHWTFVRQGGEWKIGSRNIRGIGSGEASEMFTRSTR